MYRISCTLIKVMTSGSIAQGKVRQSQGWHHGKDNMW